MAIASPQIEARLLSALLPPRPSLPPQEKHDSVRELLAEREEENRNAEAQVVAGLGGQGGSELAMPSSPCMQVQATCSSRPVMCLHSPNLLANLPVLPTLHMCLRC